MAWKRGIERKPGTGKLSFLHVPLLVQSVSIIDPADPKKGTKVRCLAASDSINSGRIRIRSSAWKFRTQGAPMLYEHGQDGRIGRSPLGRWTNFHVQEGVGMIAEGILDHFEAPDPRALIVEDIKAKRITDVSVGHAPDKLEIANQDGGAFLDVQSTTLGEISFVAVGMDGAAQHEVMEASALGFEWDEQAIAVPKECACCDATPECGCPSKNKATGICSCHKDCPVCITKKCPGKAQTNKLQSAEGLMDRKLLIQMLRMLGVTLAEDSNDAEILSAVQTMAQSARLGSKAADVLSALGLKAEAEPAEVRQAVASLKQPENFVPKADFDKLKQSLAASAIDTLIAEHKQIPAGQTAFAKSLLQQGGYEAGTDGRKLFDSWVQSLPKISTRSVTGNGSGNAPKAEGEEAAQEITTEDEEWCQTLGYFRDKRSLKGLPEGIKPAAAMAQMAEIESSEAMEWLFGQSIQPTEMDKLMREARRQQMAAE